MFRIGLCNKMQYNDGLLREAANQPIYYIQEINASD